MLSSRDSYVVLFRRHSQKGKERMKKLLVVLLCAYLLIGCGGNSTPTQAPPPPTITGAWAGTITASTGTSGALSGNLVQGVTNPDGSILFSGTLFITNSCLSSMTITNGKIAGSAFALIGSATDGSSFTITATINAADTFISGNWTAVGGTVCASGNGTFSLTKQ